MAVPEAGKLIGLGRNASYEAARRGDIPCIRVGRRIMVPVAAFHRMLDVKSRQQVGAAELCPPRKQ
jgi:Helix-turn-helix domain